MAARRTRAAGSVGSMATPTLVIVAENKAPMRRPLEGQLVLGRDPAADLTIDDGYLSRRHCAV